MPKNVTVTVSNGTPEVLTSTSSTTIGELKDELDLEGYAASINGDPASDEDILSDYSFVSFSAKVKGGNC